MMTPAAGAAIAPAPAVAAVRVECVDSAWGFTALRAEWNALLHASAADCPFLSWEWLRAWWSHLGGASLLRIAVVRAGTEVIAIAPFRVARGRVALLNRLEMLGTGEAGSDYLDVIVRRGWEVEGARALARFADSQNATVRLRHLSSTATAYDLADGLVREGWSATTRADGVCPYIPLAGHTWDSFLATLGSSHRANVRRRIKALDQKFTTQFRLVASDAERAEALAALADFHERRYADRGGSTAFTTPALRAFHEDVTRRADDRGWLRMYVLHLDEAVAAVMYGFLYNRRFYFYQHGFDDRWQQHSIGLVLMGLTIRAAIDEGADEFDMLWGEEPYKWLWARNTRALQQVHLFPPHVGGHMHRGVFHSRLALGSMARRVRTLTRRGADGS